MPSSRIVSRIAATAIIALTGGAALTTSIAQAAEIKSREEWKKEYVRPAEIPFPEDNPYTTAKAELGRTLFFDPRLSGSNYISCGTCHNPSFAWGDGLPKGIGHGMTVLGRRTPTILNLAWSESLMWDGRFETLEDQALGPMSAPVEMNQQMEAIVTELKAIPEYNTLFKVSFGGEGISIPNIAKAIATYERTVVSGIAPFDRWVAGDEVAISESAKRGFDLFNNKANCVACHSGWNFTDDSFHDVGLPDTDIGRGKQLPDVAVMQHAFKVPTLRNSVERAPYMHDGSLKNLFSVVAHYNDDFIKRPSLSSEIYKLKLSDAEQSDVVAFLKTLSSRDAPVALPRLPAFDQTLAGSVSGVNTAAGNTNDAKAAPTACGGFFQHWQTCEK
ncbi:MAG: cytochrome c peroxidase [Paracoccaceae bacterium]|jgi:cytochrome c peroxidase